MEIKRDPKISYSKELYLILGEEISKERRGRRLHMAGIILFRRYKIEPDYKEVIKWFEKAYNTGRRSSASFYLGFSYHVGEGVERNCSIALELFNEYQGPRRKSFGPRGSVHRVTWIGRLVVRKKLLCALPWSERYQTKLKH
ncbi:hypothetical protein BDF21DRAFT_395276 [Thamnidium elegans]|nr:hypothetical protein BDF21DRAFT_395276 [Thamnidium elegans]